MFDRKAWLLKEIKDFVIDERVDLVDYDFLMYEISMLSVKELDPESAAFLLSDDVFSIQASEPIKIFLVPLFINPIPLVSSLELPINTLLLLVLPEPLL